MKQTAVEYLYINLVLPLGDEEMKVFRKAQEMERQQIIDAFVDGADKGEMFNNENQAKQLILIF